MSDVGSFGEYGTPVQRVYDPAYADLHVRPGEGGYGAPHYTVVGEGAYGTPAVFVDGMLGSDIDELMMLQRRQRAAVADRHNNNGLMTIL